MLARNPAESGEYLENYDPLGGLAAFAISDMAASENITVVIRLLKTLRQTSPEAALALPLPHKSFRTFVDPSVPARFEPAQEAHDPRMNVAVQFSRNSIPRFDPI